MIDIDLPSLGEGIEEATITKVAVSKGVAVAKDDVLLELETDKASFEFPSPHAGTVEEVHVEEGDTVAVGANLVTLDAAGDRDGDEDDEPEREERESKVEEDEAEETPAAEDEPEEEPEEEPGKVGPAAGPAARRLARELGVDLDDIAAEGRVRPEDVKAYVRAIVARPPAREGRPDLPDFEQWGPVDREPLSRLRRTAADRLAAAWREIPHVTQHDEADVTELERERARYEEKRAEDEPKLTMTAVAVKAAAAALQEFPAFNSSLDAAAGELVVKRYVHVGVAVDTPHGLLVPVVRDAGETNLVAIAATVADLAARARDRSLEPGEMQGGTFTVTNLGGLGGTAFTPIVNAPEVAILGLSRIRAEADRRVLPLSLSYDHRAIDGADAVRFLRHLAGLLGSPLRLLARE